MSTEDRELLDQVRRLHSTLSRRAVLLDHVRSDVDVFAEGLRDLGNDLACLGCRCLDRVAELDGIPVDAYKRQPERISTLSGALNELALERCRDPADAGY